MRDTKGERLYSERLRDGRIAVFRGQRPKRQRASQARWDFANLRTIATRIDKETALRFHQECAARGTTAYREVKRFVENFVENPVQNPRNGGS